MTSDRELLQMALDALDAGIKISPDSELHERFRARLTQPDPEPVAWVDKVGAVIPHSHKLFQPDLLKDYTRPLYSAPQQREWQGLTDEEIWTGGSRIGLSDDGILKFAS